MSFFPAPRYVPYRETWAGNIVVFGVWDMAVERPVWRCESAIACAAMRLCEAHNCACEDFRASAKR